MRNKIIKKSIAIIMLFSIILSSISNIVFAATPFSTADLKNKGECGLHLQFKKSNGSWTYIICNFVTYTKYGKEYPAYCLNSSLHGVGDVDDYTVDVTKILDNDAVWRTITSGYPYKSPSELGLDNKYDAFVAMKQSIYCVLYDWDVSERYRGEDDRGKAIVNAMKKLVNEGRNGTRTPYTAGVTINKVGNLKEEGEYYSQEFSINCGVDVGSYTVKNSGLPNGAKVTDTNNNAKTEFTGKQNFKVIIPKNVMNKDYDIVFNVTAKAKTYPVFYGKTRIDGTQNYALSYDPLGDVYGKTTLNVKAILGHLKVVKTDSETNKVIEGVVFELLDQNNKSVGKATTDKNGEAYFKDLEAGKYKLKEISTTKDYVLNETIFDVVIENNETTIKNITNEHKKGDLKVYKVDKDNNKIGIGNVEFDLYSEEFNKVVGSYKTDVNGEISIKNLRTGIYKLVEKVTNKWYNLIGDIDVEIEENKETTKNVENELKKGQIKCIKVDKENNEIKLEGVEFELLDSNDNVLETLITDKNGEAITKKYVIRDYEELKIKETKTLKSYALDEEIRTIKLKENEITTIKFENEKRKHNVEISKADIAGKEVEGAKLQLFDKENNLIEEWVSSKDSHIIKNLIEGESYKLHEEVSANGFVKASDIEFTVSEEEKQKITMIDKILQVVKTDLVTGEEIEGAKLQITDEDGNIIDEWVSTKETHIVSNLEENKTYTLTEITCPYGYEQAESITFKVTEDKNDQLIEMKDMPILTDLRIIKIDSSTHEIIKDKFTFGLYTNKECTELIQQVDANTEDGYVDFTDIRYGHYFIKELSSPKDYELSDKVLEIEINDEGVFVDNEKLEQDDNGIYSIEFENTKIETPNTSDNSKLLIWATLLALSLASITGIGVYEHKKRKMNNK